MDEAGSYVHQTNIKLRPPKKVPTPYGGRLVYVLPGKTKLFVHLKVYKAELLQLNRTQFLSLGIFVSKKVGNRKN
jgi:hypothetical protein